MTAAQILPYASAAVVGFVATYLLTPACQKLAFALNIVDMPDERRIHQTPTPRNGGLAIFLGFHAACASFFLLSAGLGQQTNLNYDWWICLSIASTAVFILGLADDIKGFSPLLKLGGQLLIASLAFFIGFKMNSILSYQLPMPLDFILTLGWIMIIMNAFNLIDGMDGLATGLALIAAVGIFCGLLLRANLADAVGMLALAGACLAFLRFNFHPARIFLGDSGSLFLGFIVATLALSTSSKTTAILALGVPFFAVGIPLFDTMLAIWRRSLRRVLYKDQEFSGLSGIMKADALHIHHRLLRTGLSQHQVAIALYALNIALVLLALIALLYHASATGFFILSFVAGVYVIIRHLARLELWQTGRVIAEGLKRPPRRGIPSLLYPILDIAALGAGFVCALLLLNTTEYAVSASTATKVLFPIWLSIPFLLLVISGIYKRIWSRARLNDFFKLGCILVAGLLLACGVTLLSTDALESKNVFLLTIFEILLIIPAVFFNRVSMRLVLELTAMCDRRHLWPSECTRILIYGAGTRAMSLLKEMSHPDHSSFEGTHVVGFIDDDQNLWDRFVYGYKVHGGIDHLGKVAEKEQIDKLIVTPSFIPEETANELVRNGEKYDFSVTKWVTGEQPLNIQHQPAAAKSEGGDISGNAEQRKAQPMSRTSA